MIKRLRRLGLFWYGLCVRRDIFKPYASVVDIDDAGTAADCDPSVVADGGFDQFMSASEREGGGADGSLVLPACYYALVGEGPFCDFSVLADDAETSACSPPGEFCYAAAGLDSDLADPLQGGGGEDIDYTAALLC